MTPKILLNFGVEKLSKDEFDFWEQYHKILKNYYRKFYIFIDFSYIFDPYTFKMNSNRNFFFHN